MSKLILILAIFSFSIGFLVLVHQYVFHGIWFEMVDIHHETFSTAFFSLGLGILVGAAMKTGKP